VVGSSIVLLATWLYNLEAARSQKSTAIKFQYEEVAPYQVPSDANDMSIQIPRTPLTQEETALATSRPGSPSHKKRKGDSLGYFSKQHN
jgi:hypothetical protein